MILATSSRSAGFSFFAAGEIIERTFETREMAEEGSPNIASLAPLVAMPWPTLFNSSLIGVEREPAVVGDLLRIT